MVIPLKRKKEIYNFYYSEKAKRISEGKDLSLDETAMIFEVSSSTVHKISKNHTLKDENFDLDSFLTENLLEITEHIDSMDFDLLDSKKINVNFFTVLDKKMFYLWGLSYPSYRANTFRYNKKELVEIIKTQLNSKYAITRNKKDKNSYFMRISKKLKNLDKLIPEKEKKKRKFPKLKEILNLKNVEDLMEEYMVARENKWFHNYRRLNSNIEKNIICDKKKKDWINGVYHIYLSHFLRGVVDGVDIKDNELHHRSLNKEFLNTAWDLLMKYSKISGNVYNLLYKLDEKYVNEKGIFLESNKEKVKNLNNNKIYKPLIK